MGIACPRPDSHRFMAAIALRRCRDVANVLALRSQHRAVMAV